MITHPVIIAGREVEISWTQESARRFAYRMGEIGGEPTGKQFTNPRTAATAVFKVLWALLPPNLLAIWPDPESLYAVVDHDTEAEGIFNAISGIYQDRFPEPEKKSTSRNSPSQGSNSRSRKTSGKTSTRRTRTKSS